MSTEISAKTALKAVCIAFSIILFAVIVSRLMPEDPRLRESRIAFEAAQYNIKLQHLERNLAISFWAKVGLAAAFGLAAIILAAGFHRAKVRRASIQTAKIGDHLIPVHYDQIAHGDLAEHLTALANAEVLKQHNSGIEKAMEIHFALAEYEIQRFKALAHPSSGRSLPGASASLAAPAALPIPSLSFHDLLSSGQIAPGRKIPFGQASWGMEDLVTIGVAGNQGSGKSNVEGFLMASAILCEGCQVFLIDPHKGHEKGVSALVSPLEGKGLYTFTPFDVLGLVEKLDDLLSDRLSGAAPSDPGVILAIDEIVNLSHTPVWGKLVRLIERLVTEGRKACIYFLGASHTWKAKKFQGKSEIRECLNSLLILPTKVSQADLLLEDSEEKKMVKSLPGPGHGVFMRNLNPPEYVTLPKVEPEDVRFLACKLSEKAPIIDIDCETPLTKEKLKAGRERLNLSQSQFGEKVGLSQKKISRLESGESKIVDMDSDTLDRILDALDGVDGKKNNVVKFASKARAIAV